jgi:hypothetical protein
VIAREHFEDIQVVLPSSADASLMGAEYGYIFDSVPIAAVFTLMVLLALLAIEFGFVLGKRGQRKLESESMQPISTVVGAVLAMMAFVIALTFGSANS